MSVEKMRSTSESPPNKGIKHPLLFSFLLTLTILLFPMLSGVFVSVLELSELQGRVVQAFAFILASLLAFLIARARFGSLKNAVLDLSVRAPLRELLYFFPLVLIELLPLFLGFRTDLSFIRVLIYLLFTAAVGLAEEIYFRGLIAKTLAKRSLPQAIFVSSVFFALGHFLNLMAGASLLDTLLQVVFAYFFGVVALEIVLLRGSLLSVIIWHAAHNFISLITNKESQRWLLIIGLVQGFLLLAYGLFLLLKLRDKGLIGGKTHPFIQ